MMALSLPILVAAALGLPGVLMAAECRPWSEPARTYPEGAAWHCVAYRWADGDMRTVTCEERGRPVRVRVRGVDTVERGKAGWTAARLELRRQTEAVPLLVLPHHGSSNRVVASVLVSGADLGRRMHAAGWSKATCPRR